MGPGGKAPGSGAGQFHARVSLEPGDGGVVDAPFGAGQLGVSVRRELNCQPGKRGVMAVSADQLASHLEHGLLDLGMEHVVVGSQTADRRVGFGPGESLRPDPADAVALRPVAAERGFKLRQRGGEFQGGD